jgi:hypothetical protein
MIFDMYFSFDELTSGKILFIVSLFLVCRTSHLISLFCPCYTGGENAN